MAQLIYVNMMSLDGYIGRDRYDWANPGEDGHAFITEATREIGTYLYGRKTFQTMAVWDKPESFFPSPTPAVADYARVWQAADKIVYSKTLNNVQTGNTRLAREFDPQAIRELKTESARDISVGGPELAAQAIRFGLVDEYRLFVAPAMIGDGIPVMPKGTDIKLELLEERRFGPGFVYLRYGTGS